MLAYPFDSQLSYDDETGEPIYDRAVSSLPLKTLIRKLFTTGVMPNPSTNFQVSVVADSMQLEVAGGFAVIDGGLVREDSETTLELDASDTSYNRIDTVVLRWNENIDVRAVDLYIKKGTPASTPVRPTLQRSNSIYEIGLADILVTKNITVITASAVTDTRMESERCGIVSSVSEWDTTTIYNQIQADLTEFKSEEQAEFIDWFEHLQYILDGDVAGHLQNEIDDTNEKLNISNANFAPVENTDVASRDYIGADLFIGKDGNLYMTEGPITEGGTFIYESSEGVSRNVKKINNYYFKDNYALGEQVLLNKYTNAHNSQLVGNTVFNERAFTTLYAAQWTSPHSVIITVRTNSYDDKIEIEAFSNSFWDTMSKMDITIGAYYAHGGYYRKIYYDYGNKMKNTMGVYRVPGTNCYAVILKSFMFANIKVTVTSGEGSARMFMVCCRDLNDDGTLDSSGSFNVKIGEEITTVPSYYTEIQTVMEL